MVPPSLPAWRRALIVVGALLGLYSGFMGMYYSTLPFFLLPIAGEFGWGRGDVAAASVLSMLGMSLAAPFVGRLFDRFGSTRVLGLSITLFVLALLSLRYLPPNLLVFGALSFSVGVVGAATGMAGYLSILPRWFDQRLGLALGVAGLGIGIGLGVNSMLSATLIQRLGWRDAYAALAAISLAVSVIAWLLINPRQAGQHVTATNTRPAAGDAAAEGMSLRAALASVRFWILLLAVFLATLAIFGFGIHSPALYADHGFTPQQAGLGTALGGLGSIVGRLATGYLLDRFFAPRIAALTFATAAAGMLLGATAHNLPMLLGGSLLAGLAIGAEGDLLPYMVRRYFGLQALGAIFGSILAAYSLAGLAGPVIYGKAFDQQGSYAGILSVAVGLCLISAILVLSLGRYRYLPRANAAPPG